MTPTRLARNISTAAVASIAAWSSWSHMVDVALRFGERPEVALVLPISVDGMLIVASTAMVEDKREGRPVRWSARVAFVAGVAASVAANIAAAHPTLGARIVAAWPAVALLLVVEMLSRARPAIDLPPPHMVKREPRGGAEQPRSDAPVSVLAPKVPSPLNATQHTTGNNRKFRSAALPRTRDSEQGERTVDLVARLRAERPGASLADIADAAGVSERHARRLLTSKQT
ncbi:DUF2637 domain-containing protein [Micromonospora sp. ALFpr18c]|uniref:DUF2637 domain-containing protein n=1 Tax=Micromonospora sp. ALFpr18c TaxID=1458665 RepID=UPI00124B2B75|nr:DUF2637 domain-containing protein [Micromonospora sp. ALFpr18c]KAB1947548.1 DUF2637 domain-containing protein [Micromonospora sp. ALFpr18c]